MEGWRKIWRLRGRARAETVQSRPVGRGETKGMEDEKPGHVTADGWGVGGNWYWKRQSSGTNSDGCRRRNPGEGDCAAEVTSPLCVFSLASTFKAPELGLTPGWQQSSRENSCPFLVAASPDPACKHYLFWKATALFSNKTLGHAVLDFPDLTLT